MTKAQGLGTALDAGGEACLEAASPQADTSHPAVARHPALALSGHRTAYRGMTGPSGLVDSHVSERGCTALVGGPEWTEKRGLDMTERDTTDANLARLAARIGGYWQVAKDGPEGRSLIRRMPALAAMLEEADRLDRERERQTVRDDVGRDITA